MIPISEIIRFRKSKAMKAKILELAARLVGEIKKEQVQQVVTAIQDAEALNIPSEQKFKVVVDFFQRLAPRAVWVAQTVVQLVFAYVKIKGLLNPGDQNA